MKRPLPKRMTLLSRAEISKWEGGAIHPYPPLRIRNRVHDTPDNGGQVVTERPDYSRLSAFARAHFSLCRLTWTSTAESAKSKKAKSSRFAPEVFADASVGVNLVAAPGRSRANGDATGCRRNRNFRRSKRPRKRPRRRETTWVFFLGEGGVGFGVRKRSLGARAVDCRDARRHGNATSAPVWLPDGGADYDAKTDEGFPPPSTPINRVCVWLQPEFRIVKRREPSNTRSARRV